MATIGQKKARASKTGTYTSKSGKTYTASGATSSNVSNNAGSSTLRTYEIPTATGYKTVQAGSKADALNLVPNAQLKGSTGSNVPSTINSEIFKQTTPYNIEPQPQQNVQDVLNRAVGMVQQTPATQEDAVAEQQKKTFQDYLDNIQKPPNLSKLQNQLENKYQLEQKRQAVNNYQTQLNTIVSKAQADVLSVTGQGRGIPEVIIGGQQAQINKEAAIQALPVQALLSSAQGDLQSAESHVDKLFQIYAQDAQNQVDYYNKQASMVYDFVDKQYQQQINSIKESKKFSQDMLIRKMDSQQNYAEIALKNGQISAFNAITSIQPPTNLNSPTYQEDLASYEQKINRAVSKYAVGAPVSSGKAPTVTKINGQDYIWDSTSGKFIPAPIAGGGGNELQKAQLSSNVQQISDLTNNFVKSAVGTSGFTRSGVGRIGTALAGAGTGALAGSFLGPIGTAIGGVAGLATGLYAGAPSELTGSRQNFVAGVDQLTSGLTLQSLINAKTQGATFGALSEGELALLSNSASKINKWAIREDNKVDGQVLGYNANEKDFKAELDKIKVYAIKDAIIKGVPPAEVGAVTHADGTVWIKDSFGNYTQIQ